MIGAVVICVFGAACFAGGIAVASTFDSARYAALWRDREELAGRLAKFATKPRGERGRFLSKSGQSEAGFEITVIGES